LSERHVSGELVRDRVEGHRDTAASGLWKSAGLSAPRRSPKRHFLGLVDARN
jgi:hypothetical protein